MPGAARVATSGSATATDRSRTSATRGTTIAGADSSVTGSRVKAGMAQSETIRAPATTAAIVAISSGAQNATRTSRRSALCGQTVSAIARRLGRAMIRTSTAGPAM
jgi:hypothetical protein